MGWRCTATVCVPIPLITADNELALGRMSTNGEHTAHNSLDMCVGAEPCFRHNTNSLTELSSANGNTWNQ